MLNVALIIGNLIVLVSAFMRLNLYESAYGFTRSRIYSHVFIIWLGILLIVAGILAWKKKVRSGWTGVKIVALAVDRGGQHVSGRFRVKAIVDLGALSPRDISIELYHGALNPEGEITQGKALALQYQGRTPDGCHVFDGSIPCTRTGHHGLNVRIIPYNRGLLNKFDTGLITWLEEPFKRIGFDEAVVEPEPEEVATQNEA